jgi:D-erythro-7,8-dihydroneopterin triphosphate epimerase
MSDKIIIADLLLRTIIGINEDERLNRQDVLINITLDVDTRKAGESDNIEDAVNYRTITKEVISLVESSRFLLVEKLAEEVAKICLKDSRVNYAEVRLEKPAALRFSKSVGLQIKRSQKNG